MNLICRTCMQLHQDHISIFEYSETSKNLSEMLLHCTTIEIQKDDGLPLYICNSCLKTLTSAWGFRIMAIKSDSKLRNIFKKRVKPNTTEKNSTLTDTIIVKEKAVAKSGIFTLSDVNKNSMAERYTKVNHDFMQKDKQKDIKLLKHVYQYNSDKKVSNSALKIIPQTCVKEKITKSIGTDEEHKFVQITNKFPLANNVKLKPLDYDEKNLAMKCISNCISDNNTSTSEERDMKTEMEDNTLKNICTEENSLTNDDEAINVMLPFISDHQYSCNVTTISIKADKSFKNLQILNKVPLTNDVKQDVLLDSLDYGDEKSLTMENGCNRVSDNNIIVSQDSETVAHDTILKNICTEDNSIVANEDKAINETIPVVTNQQYNCNMSINGADSSNKEEMKLEMYSEERIKKLSYTEREQLLIFCRICNRAFRYRYYFGMHIRLHNGDRPHKCDICDKSFVWQWQLRVHMAVHSELRPFSCKLCDKSFKTRNCLSTHKYVHSEETPYTCNICPKTFKTRGLQRFHIVRHNNEKNYTCEICGKSFSDPSSIYSHRFTHTDEKNITCPTCGKTYINKLSLRRHLRLHMGLRPYPCTYCDKRFKRKSSRDEHISIHTGEKPHVCKICSKSFRHSAALYNHQRIHKREAQFACNICPSQFKYSRHLQNHMKVHE